MYGSAGDGKVKPRLRSAHLSSGVGRLFFSIVSAVPNMVSVIDADHARSGTLVLSSRAGG